MTEEDLYGWLSSIVEAYHRYSKARTAEGKQRAFENLQQMCKVFLTAVNSFYQTNYSLKEAMLVVLNKRNQRRLKCNL